MKRRLLLFLLVSLLATGPGFAAGWAPAQLAAGAPDAFGADLPESAIARALPEDGVPQLEARLVVSRDPSLQVGVLFDLAPGWHLYWKNPGDTGIAPRLDLRADGYAPGELVWPTPIVFEEADGLFTTYGYEGRVLLGAPLTRRVTESAGEQVSVEADVLICRTECVPASFSLSTPLDLDLPIEQQTSIDRAFLAARESAPRTVESLGLEARARWSAASPTVGETGRLEVSIRSCADGVPDERCPAVPEASEAPLFIPGPTESFELANIRLGAMPSSRTHFTLEIEALRLEEDANRLQGLVLLRDAAGERRYAEIDLPIASERAAGEAAIASDAPPAPIIAWGRWAQIFLLALLGGLILNGMPCVLPVLAIKVVAVADLAAKDRREVRIQGLAYTIGVLGSMGILAAVVLGLRAAGHSVGWGFQFQEPLFVAAISAILVSFALNLFGVFEIELGQGRLAAVGQESTGTMRSIFEGLLAVVLATPCTAPFLGTAVGFAFASSGLGIVAIFLAIGLGLASPFLAVSFFPGMARFIPRSGPWMLKLRAGLGFSLLATTVWLLWVLGQSGGTDAVITTVSALLFLAFLLWVFGQLQPVHNVWLGRASAATILCLALLGFNWIELDPKNDTEAQRDPGSVDHEGWTAWTEDGVSQALAGGRPSFVVFTADWCLTCQVNERTVLEREDVRAALHEHGYSLFKADWTRRDEVIRRKLAEFGRAGVPLYLVYSPEAPGQPQILSELLSQREVLAALAKPVAPPRI